MNTSSKNGAMKGNQKEMPMIEVDELTNKHIYITNDIILGENEDILPCYAMIDLMAEDVQFHEK